MLNDIERHNRTVMLNRVKNYWLKGVLEESLHGGELIDLSLAYRPSALADSVEPQWQQTSEYDIPLPFGTKISTVFSAAGGELLILGDPGAGKTTMLLQLVNDLLAYAEGDEERPIPVVFSLASWNDEQPLDEWLIGELSNNYEVPHQLSRSWIANKGFVPLLDGLDEVEQEQRRLCADAINSFRQRYPQVWMLVTTRSQDYHALSTRLQLDKAIVLQSLSIEQIDLYLSSRGQRLAGLRAALYQDATLRELAQSPLMLSIMTLAYYRVPAEVAFSLGNRETGRNLLFDVYVERMSRYRSGEKEYASENTIHWLSWLARKMERQNRTMFFLENMQPSWLPSTEHRSFTNRLKLIVLLSFIFLAAIAGLIGYPSYGLPGLGVALLLGALAGLMPILSRRLLLGSKIEWDRIETVETIGWSWPWTWLGLAAGGLAGLLAGLLLAWIDGRSAATGVPWFLLLPLFSGAGLVLDRAVLRSEVKIRTTPGQGLRQSRQNGLRIGIVTTVATAVLATLILFASSLLGLQIPWMATLPWLAGAASLLGLTAGLAYGGLGALQFRRLRSTFCRLGTIPDEYVHFLDYAAERSLLRRVGGGYTFMHALLLDYFAKRTTADPAGIAETKKTMT
ncbi:MAG: NACHT domain-containing protein [Chloroflexi bacterium]|jgi:hypothetical protein|nr:NACHT domain-containing protein [Chloroflexota bacterium]